MTAVFLADELRNFDCIAFKNLLTFDPVKGENNFLRGKNANSFFSGLRLCYTATGTNPISTPV